MERGRDLVEAVGGKWGRRSKCFDERLKFSGKFLHRALLQIDGIEI